MDAEPRIRVPSAGFLVVFVAPLAFLLVIVPGLFAAGVVPAHLKSPSLALPAVHGLFPDGPLSAEPANPPAAQAPVHSPLHITVPAPLASLAGAAGAPATPAPVTLPPSASSGSGSGGSGPGSAEDRDNHGKHLGQIKHNRTIRDS